MRQYNLTSAKAGITRLRDKGGASPETLYDLVNGYVTAARSIKARPGSVTLTAIDSGLIGLTTFDDKLHVFTSNAALTSPDPLVVVNILRHPTDVSQALTIIHFAEPFLGYLYVAAEFANGDVFHYWLQPLTTWIAGKNYTTGELVEPTTPNGFAYRASRTSPTHQPWAAGAARAIGDQVEPTVYNGYYYQVSDVAGDNPSSGVVEPAWPVIAGQTVVELTEITAAPPPPSSGGSTPPPTGDRYTGVMGNRTGGGFSSQSAF